MFAPLPAAAAVAPPQSQITTSISHVGHKRPLDIDEAKPYPCKIAGCGKRFTLVFHRNQHERTHTGERPYPCSFCGKRFATLRDRNVHERTHSGERPYPCRVGGCGERFTVVCNRNKHERTHTGERPYLCSFGDCGERFATSGARDAHVRIHPNGRTAMDARARNAAQLDDELARLARLADTEALSTLSEAFAPLSQSVWLNFAALRTTLVPGLRGSLPRYGQLARDCGEREACGMGLCATRVADGDGVQPHQEWAAGQAAVWEEALFAAIDSNLTGFGPELGDGEYLFSLKPNGPGWRVPIFGPRRNGSKLPSLTCRRIAWIAERDPRACAEARVLMELARQGRWKYELTIGAGPAHADNVRYQLTHGAAQVAGPVRFRAPRQLVGRSSLCLFARDAAGSTGARKCSARDALCLADTPRDPGDAFAFLLSHVGYHTDSQGHAVGPPPGQLHAGERLGERSIVGILTGREPAEGTPDESEVRSARRAGLAFLTCEGAAAADELAATRVGGSSQPPVFADGDEGGASDEEPDDSDEEPDDSDDEEGVSE